MYGGYYGMSSGMRGNYDGVSPMAQQPMYVQARMRGPMGPSPQPGMMGGTVGMANSNAGNGNTTAAAHQMSRNASFMMMHNLNSYGDAGPRGNGSMQGGRGSMGGNNNIGGPGGGCGYMCAVPRFSSFGAATNPFQRSGSFSSLGAGSLHRMNSGLNFDYYNNSQTNFGEARSGAPLLRNNSGYGSMRRGSFMGMPNADSARGPPPQQQSLSRQNSGLGSSYSYGSFRQPSFSQGSVHNGATGVGPNMSMNSIASATAQASQQDFGGGAAGTGLSNVRTNPADMPSPTALARQDSAMSLQRSYSIAGQFYNYNMKPSMNMGNSSPVSGNNNNASANGAGGMPGPQYRLSIPMGMMMGPMGPSAGMTMTISGLDGRMNQRTAGLGAMSAQAQQAMMQQQMLMQRRLAGNNGMAEMDPNAAPPKGTSENVVVEEGQSMALGRKSSVQNLTRKPSEKRVGMYFKNKDASEATDGSAYKKEGDTGTLGKNNARARDPSLTNTVKASIVLDTSAGTNSAIEVDGRTVRAEKSGAEEVQKYDMRDVIFANRKTDVELLSDSLEEMRDNFVYGCNVGMIMADAGMSSAHPTEWFTWLALKSVVKGAFGKLASTTFEFTMSVCFLQDDQVMDLLADEPQSFTTLTVAESPLFGNVANGMVYVCVEDAGEFNDVLESSLCRAQQQCSDSSEEHGIVLCTCVLKQVKTSSSTGKQDVLVSSIFASGVGDGVIHYNRILDKNPAEPRALFYSVLHRSVHSTALFSCDVTDDEVFNYLATLQRFAKTETRRPKVGSTRAFVSYGTSTIPKIREDLEKAKDPRQRLMMQRQLEKLELMVADAEEMLANPTECVPKTYI